jgi:hypothetical protein
VTKNVLARATSAFFMTVSLSCGVGQAADLMRAADENAVVQKYCGTCHSDALMYGGMSVQHFDAAHPDPTLTAMLLNKITRGHTPRDVSGAESAAVLQMMKASAMGAAGGGVPNEETQVAFARSLSMQSKGAYGWNVAWDGAGAQDRTPIASILREKPSVKREGSTDSYRLTVSCRTGTLEGEIKVAWADFAAGEGQMMPVAVDSAASFQHKVEGGRAQGNGNNGPGSTVLKISRPMQSLTIGNLFADGNIVFPFGELSPAVRQDLSACFPGNQPAGH